MSEELVTTPTTYRLDLPWPRPPLNHNQRGHWSRRSPIIREVRDTTAWLAKAAKIPACSHITVQLHYAPGRRGKLDPMNLTATSKPAIDGLVDAGVVPDDDSTHVFEMTPAVYFPPELGPKCWLTVEVVKVPQRIQRKRTKGWRLPAGAVIVDRTSKYGNPFLVGDVARRFPSLTIEQCQQFVVNDFISLVDSLTLQAKHGYPSREQIRAELAGKDLACWCELDDPCHGNVLLAVANEDVSL